MLYIYLLIVKDVHEEEPSSTVEETEPKTQQDQTNVNEERLKEPNDGAYRLLDLMFNTSLLIFFMLYLLCVQMLKQCAMTLAAGAP